eukprot:4517550-Amphidinium_carterae.1
MGSSDSDGFVPVEMEEVRSLANKANDHEIRRLEKNLARLKTARRKLPRTRTLRLRIQTRVSSRCASLSQKRNLD